MIVSDFSLGIKSVHLQASALFTLSAKYSLVWDHSEWSWPLLAAQVCPISVLRTHALCQQGNLCIYYDLSSHRDCKKVIQTRDRDVVYEKICDEVVKYDVCLQDPTACLACFEKRQSFDPMGCLFLPFTFFNISISIQLCVLYALLFFITFTENNSPVEMRSHFTTCPKVPWPNRSITLYLFNHQKMLSAVHSLTDNLDHGQGSRLL